LEGSDDYSLIEVISHDMPEETEENLEEIVKMSGVPAEFETWARPDYRSRLQSVTAAPISEFYFIFFENKRRDQCSSFMSGPPKDPLFSSKHPPKIHI
jgi:hypothetical protein